MHNHLYHQLGQKERDRIFLLKKKGLTNAAIAVKLGRDKSTIGRELRRNVHQRLHQYLPDTAQRKAQKRKAHGRKVRYVVKDPVLKRRIVRLLKGGWSPDLIACRAVETSETHSVEPGKYLPVHLQPGRTETECTSVPAPRSPYQTEKERTETSERQSDSQSC